MVPQKPLQGCKAPDCSRSTLPWVDMKYSSLSTERFPSSKILKNKQRCIKHQVSSKLRLHPYRRFVDDRDPFPERFLVDRGGSKGKHFGSRSAKETYQFHISSNFSIYIGDFTAVQIVPSSYKNQQDFHDEHYDIHCMSSFVSMATTKET